MCVCVCIYIYIHIYINSYQLNNNEELENGENIGTDISLKKINKWPIGT